MSPQPSPLPIAKKQKQDSEEAAAELDFLNERLDVVLVGRGMC